MLCCLHASRAYAQNPPLAPTTSISLPTGAILRYSSISIPAGVTVTFTGSAPAVLVCDGDCIIRGTLSAAATATTGGPGAYDIAPGRPGVYCPGFCPLGCSCWPQSVTPTSGQHFGVYGSDLPCSLTGGSRGGDHFWRDSSNPVFGGCCDIITTMIPGGHGGGALALLAGGRIDIHGVIDVTGSSNWLSANGSAGSLLLRGLGGTTLWPGGQLRAGPSSAEGGYLRVDAWGGSPVVHGSLLAPAPRLVELPLLRAATLPVLGTSWSVEAFVPDQTLVVLAAALQPGSNIATLFGSLAIDLNNAVTVNVGVARSASHDPVLALPVPIPNASYLLGLPLWLQAFAVPTVAPPRLSNALAVVVQ